MSCVCIVVVDCVIADDQEQRTISNITNDVRPHSREYLTSVKSGLHQDRGEYLTAVDSHHWNDTSSYLTSVDSRSTDSAEQFNGSSETGHKAANIPQQARFNDSNQTNSPSVDAVNINTRTGSSRQSSAMKLKCNAEPHSQPQEHIVPTSGDPGSPLSPSQLPVTSSVEVSAQDRKSSVTSDKSSSQSTHPTAGHTSPQSRRTLSNEPLGAEFDVKQIKVRAAASNGTSSDDPFDFFADMAPVIITSSASVPQKSLLGLLSAAAADVSSPQLTSQLNVTDPDYLDSSVSCCN